MLPNNIPSLIQIYFRMGLLSSANQTVCNQIVSLFQDSSNTTNVCTSLGDTQTTNEVFYIIGLLLAPIFACLTIAMFLFVFYTASRTSEYFSRMIYRFKEHKAKAKGSKVNDKKQSIVIDESLVEQAPRKPPRYKNTST